MLGCIVQFLVGLFVSRLKKLSSIFGTTISSADHRRPHSGLVLAINFKSNKLIGQQLALGSVGAWFQTRLRTITYMAKQTYALTQSTSSISGVVGGNLPLRC